MSNRLVLTVMKNEGAFVLDWIAHNLALGFDHFHIFTNDCDDGTDAMAARLQALGLATHVDQQSFEDRGPQWAALNDPSLKSIANGYWVFVSDVDEYLCIHAGDGTLNALEAACPDAGAISVPWRFFGANGQWEFEDKPVCQRFLKTSPYPLFYPRQALMCKTLYCKSDAVQKPGVHGPRIKQHAHWQDMNWVNGDGRRMVVFDPKTPILMGPNAGIGLAQINHYALRAAKSFLVKAARGLANRKSAAIDLTYWMRRNFNAIEDHSIARLAPAVALHRARLAKDPVLSKLHRTACLWHQQEAERLASTRRGLDLLSGITLSGDSKIVSAPDAQRIYAYHQKLRAAELAK